MKMLRLFVFVGCLLVLNASLLAQAKKKEMYEVRIYEARFSTPQMVLENYLKNALIPALNKYGVKNIGVFKEVGKSEPAKLYVVIPYPSMEEYPAIKSKLSNDEAFKKASLEYDTLPADKAPFVRANTSLLLAFDSFPKIVAPNKEPRIFEMRTYEGYNENATRRKIKMFNVDELQIFRATQLHSVFFGEMIAGELTPSLTYMLTFKDMQERDSNWKMFVAHPDWKRISALPEYANSVSRITKVFLEPTDYSQL